MLTYPYGWTLFSEFIGVQLGIYRVKCEKIIQIGSLCEKLCMVKTTDERVNNHHLLISYPYCWNLFSEFIWDQIRGVSYPIKGYLSKSVCPVKSYAWSNKNKMGQVDVLRFSSVNYNRLKQVCQELITRNFQTHHFIENIYKMLQLVQNSGSYSSMSFSHSLTSLKQFKKKKEVTKIQKFGGHSLFSHG